MNEEELKKKYGTNNLGNPDIDEDDFMSEEDKIMEEIKLYGKDKNYPIIERIQGIIQKGKLEQKKEELEFLDDCFRVYRGEKYIQSDSISKLIERIKQLQKEIKVSGDSLTEFWDNPEDNRWDKEYNPDLLPETLKNKEEKQDE